jgi:uncharacterized DUF497 family protein
LESSPVAFAWDDANITHLGETDAGRRLAVVFTIRQHRVRFITAYAMTREQQEIYEKG